MERRVPEGARRALEWLAALAAGRGDRGTAERAGELGGRLASVPTPIRWGEGPVARVRSLDGRIEEIPPGDLEASVTERGNPGDRRGVARAELTFPAEPLRGGALLVDTPGVGSVSRTTTEPARVLFAVSEIDLPSGIDRPEAIADARRVIGGAVGHDVRLHPVSARRALLAKLVGDRRQPDLHVRRATEDLLARVGLDLDASVRREAGEERAVGFFRRIGR